MTGQPPTEDASTRAETGINVSDASAPTELTQDQKVGHYIDMWKQTVTVQMHFNDIEWRIRGLALSVATFALGAAGVTAKAGAHVGWFSLASLIIVSGLLLWYAFYYVDRFWYHPLLKAAVTQGTQIEDEVKKILPQAGMTAAITAGSPQLPSKIQRIRFGCEKNEMHSDDKLVWFYLVGALALVLAAIGLQIALVVTSTTGSPSGP